jgi:hypothetical protein
MKNLIIKILKEETEDRLKNFFFKLWDQQKEKQGVAFYDEDLLKKLGLYEPKDKRHRIWEYYVDYMGGKKNQTKEFINYLENKVFSSTESKDIQERVNFDFKFKLYNVDINLRRELKGSFFIIQGTWYDQDSGERYSVITGQNEIDDMGTYFDLQYEIGEGISDFVTDTARKFGLMLNSVDIREYKVN